MILRSYWTLFLYGARLHALCLVFLSPALHHARWLNYEVAAVSGPANGNLNAGREGKLKGSKFLSAGEMESDRSLARAVPLRGATAVIHLASPPPSHPTLPCLSNLPGTPPPRLSSLPARPPSSSSATVAAPRSFSYDPCVNDARNNRADEDAVGAGWFRCMLV